MRGLPSLTGAALAAIVLLGAGPAAHAAVPEVTNAPGWASAARVVVERDVAVRPGATHTPRLPPPPFALSLTLRAAPGAALRVTGRRGALVADLRARADGRLVVRTTARVASPPPIAARRWVHRVELVRSELTVDGEPVGPGGDGPLRLTAAGSAPVRITTLVATPGARRDALLLHRVADLHARTPPGRFPLGEGADGRLRFSGGWTSGFWPGALWEATRLVPGGPYTGWALDASLARRGAERTPIHDVGFMFGRSVVVAYERLCHGAATARCRSLRASGLAAADTLLRLAGTTATGMVPTDAAGAEAQTIVDSLMNVGLLAWATRVSGDPRYAALARRHATLVLGLLQRDDGSTFQVAVHDRATGRLLRRGTRQGLSDASTWARGQAWAIYGLAEIGRDAGDAALVAGAERAAAFWMAAAPARGLPPYDLSAGPAAPRDSSAGAIAAAGMYRLARACRSVPGACASPARWTRAASATLDAALTAVSTTPPLGRLGEQAYTVGPRNGSWDDRAELIWGLDFALEAIAERHLAA